MGLKMKDIYSLFIANWLSGGNTLRRNRMNATDIVTEFNAIFTKSHVKRIYRVTGIKPRNVDLDFISFIRNQMFELHPDVEVIVNMSYYPTRVDTAGDKFNRAMNKASQNYSTYKEVFESQSGLAKLTGKTYRMPGGGRLRITKERLDDLGELFYSYLELYDNAASGGTIALVEIFIELVAENLKDIKRASEDLFGIMSSTNFGIQEIKSANKVYLEQFGPAVGMPNKLHKKFLPQLLFTDKNTSAFTPYKSRGLVGGSGILFGLDFRSRLPFMANIFAAPTAEVFLMNGKTGSGKTFAAWQMALSALSTGFSHVTAIDIKGREWSRLSSLVKTKIITFDEKNPSFVNTLRLDDMHVTEGNAEELFQTAIRGTTALLSLIVNLQAQEGNPSDLELVLREAVQKVYSQRGVTPKNIASFQNTADLHYGDILPILESLSTTVTYTVEQRKMLHLARSRCYAYIGDSGLFSSAFTNEITLSDIMTTPLVIYEFNKNQNAMTDSLDVLRIFMVQFLDSKKKAMLREQNRFLFCFYEELQRCDQFGSLLSYICGEVTGARSNNAVVVLLLNSLKVLQGPEAQDIRSNITSFISGAVERNDIRTYYDDFGQSWLAHQLELFSERPSAYRHCFAATVDTGVEVLQTVYRVEFPEDIRAMFQTRTTKEIDEL